MLEAVITEAVYVLSARAHYHLTREEIRERLAPIIRLPGLKLAGKQRYLHALDLYVAYPDLDFEDALIVAAMQERGIIELLSYDTDFDRVPGITRMEPAP